MADTDDRCGGRLAVSWHPWVPLEGCWKGSKIPDLPGLYRIRREGHGALDYLGQTGRGKMTLRRRLYMLRGIYADVMPYRDPHTAGPALWALRHEDGTPFEVSVAPVVGETRWRLGLEALTIALHRQEHGFSPTVEFGRVPRGYRASSGYNKKLVAAGKLFHGGPSIEADPGHHAGVPPNAPLEGDPEGAEWGKHEWSPWLPVREAARRAKEAVGLYRMRGAPGEGLLYVGQGTIGHRLRSHARKFKQAGNAQGSLLGGTQTLEASWIAGEWLAHQRLELECDLIAAHLVATCRLPPAQYLG